MKRSRFTPEQIIGILKENESGAKASAAAAIASTSDWTEREYHCYIYLKDGEYGHTKPVPGPVGAAEFAPPPFKGPGQEIGEIHSHFAHPQAVNPERWSPPDIWRSRQRCGDGKCESYLLTPSETLKRVDWRAFPHFSVYDPITDTWKQ